MATLDRFNYEVAKYQELRQLFAHLDGCLYDERKNREVDMEKLRQELSDTKKELADTKRARDDLIETERRLRRRLDERRCRCRCNAEKGRRG